MTSAEQIESARPWILRCARLYSAAFRGGLRSYVRQELVQEGYLAASRAVMDFDPDLGFQFFTYASKVIDFRVRNSARRMRAWFFKSVSLECDYREHAERPPPYERLRTPPNDPLAEWWTVVTRALRPRSRQMLIAKFCNGLTYRQLGRQFRITGGRAQQVVARALSDIRNDKILMNDLSSELIHGSVSPHGKGRIYSATIHQWPEFDEDNPGFENAIRTIEDG